MKKNNLKEKNGRNSCSIEPEKIVNGLHKAIINSEIFNKVQYQLNVKSKCTILVVFIIFHLIEFI